METEVLRTITFGLALTMSVCPALQAQDNVYRAWDGDHYVVAEIGDENWFASVSLSDNVLDEMWRVRCSVNPMTDARICSASYELGGPILQYVDGVPALVCIFENVSSGQGNMMRIDDQPPFHVDFEGCSQDKALIDSVLAGSRFRAQFMSSDDYQLQNTEVDITLIGKVNYVIKRMFAGEFDAPGSSAGRASN